MYPKTTVQILPYRRHYGGIRKGPIKHIAIHHTVARWDAKQLGEFFKGGSRWASSNYGIGYDGSVGLYVPENMRAYTTSTDLDEQAITIEVNNSVVSGNYPISDISMEVLIDLCVYICEKYGIKECTYTGDSKGTLLMHKWFDATSCPGPYLSSKFPYIAQEVTKRLKGSSADVKPTTPPSTGTTLYRVQVGAFKVRDNAVAREAELKKKGYDTYLILADGLFKVQVGAYAKKANADAMAEKLKKDGYSIYVTTKGGAAVTATKSLAELAAEVYAGKWGNGQERYEKLTKAGYSYDEVQAEVNRRYY